MQANGRTVDGNQGIQFDVEVPNTMYSLKDETMHNLGRMAPGGYVK